MSVVHQTGQKEKKLQPRERFELSTPGLQDQCSNHWANEADTLVKKFTFDAMNLFSHVCALFKEQYF